MFFCARQNNLVARGFQPPQNRVRDPENCSGRPHRAIILSTEHSERQKIDKEKFNIVPGDRTEQ